MLGKKCLLKSMLLDTPASQCFSLNEALESAFNEASGRVSILLSPGFSSFDQFRNYQERGETFNQCVQELKKRFATSTQELLY
jgi:UDP-N-acetylmuramoylalanine-D-glutamate ligase